MVDNPDEGSIARDGVINFHYQKSPLYRAIHCDGFYGGSTPRGYVSVSFFNERPAIPRHSVRRIISSDEKTFTAGPEEVVESLNGVVRHVETTLFMDLNAAREFYDWFGDNLSKLEQLAGKMAENIQGERK